MALSSRFQPVTTAIPIALVLEPAMKKRLIVIVACLGACTAHCRGQVSGNVGYSQGGGRARAEQNERNKRGLTKDELPPSSTSMFVEANVLWNVRADEYIVVFGIGQEGETVTECNRKMDATVKQFSDEVKTLGIGAGDFFVDFVAQNKIYGFEVTGNLAREKLVGFELKKNVSIRYKETSVLDKLVVAASRVANLRPDQGRLHRRGFPPD